MKQMQEEKSAEMIKMQEITVMRKKMKACKWCLMKLWEEIHNF